MLIAKIAQTIATQIWPGKFDAARTIKTTTAITASNKSSAVKPRTNSSLTFVLLGTIRTMITSLFAITVLNAALARTCKSMPQSKDAFHSFILLHFAAKIQTIIRDFTYFLYLIIYMYLYQPQINKKIKIKIIFGYLIFIIFYLIQFFENYFFANYLLKNINRLNLL